MYSAVKFQFHRVSHCTALFSGFVAHAHFHTATGLVLLITVTTFTERRIAEMTQENIIQNPSLTQRSSPALRLPCELLQEIFRLAYSRKVIHDTPEIPHFLFYGHVCSYWRYALISYPYMWSRISLPSYPSELKDQCLTYSKDRSLEIYILGNGFDSGLDPIFRHMHRIKSLFIEGRVEMDMTRHLLRPAPRLEVLGISLERSLEIESNSSSLFQRQTPNLKSVTLRGISNAPFRFLLSNLIHLNLQRIRDIPALDELLDILESCPRLQSLHARYLSDIAPPTDIPVDRYVELSSVTFLELQASTSFLSAFLRHTFIPVSANWTLRCSDINILSDPSFLSFRLRYTTGKTGLSLIAGNVHFASIYEYNDENVENPIRELSINVGSASMPFLLNKLSDSGILSQVLVLKLNYLAMSSAKGFYHSILWRVPDIRYLIVMAKVQLTSAQNLNCLWDVLSTKSDVPHESFPCPSLKELSIYASINTTPVFYALLSCLRRRHSQNPLDTLRIVANTSRITQVDAERLAQYAHNIDIDKRP